MLFLITISASGQDVKVKSGSLKTYKDFPSKFVEPRTVDIWFPEGYTTAEQYPVLYMHDGQMLFDAAMTWNHQSWEADDVAAALMAKKEVKKFIIVGIHSIANNRHGEYMPEKPFKSLPKNVQDSIYNLQRDGKNVFNLKVSSDNYLKFIVSELKPYIDENFATKKDQANTFIAGSSMGGLISLYAISEYPEVFGGAACISTHWPGVMDAKKNPLANAFFAYMKTKLPSAANHRLYFDYGTETLDAAYGRYQKQADKIIQSKGYTNKNWMTKEFKGADHSEKSWTARFDEPLVFLFGK